MYPLATGIVQGVREAILNHPIITIASAIAESETFKILCRDPYLMTALKRDERPIQKLEDLFDQTVVQMVQGTIASEYASDALKIAGLGEKVAYPLPFTPLFLDLILRIRLVRERLRQFPSLNRIVYQIKDHLSTISHVVTLISATTLLHFRRSRSDVMAVGWIAYGFLNRAKMIPKELSRIITCIGVGHLNLLILSPYQNMRFLKTLLLGGIALEILIPWFKKFPSQEKYAVSNTISIFDDKTHWVLEKPCLDHIAILENIPIFPPFQYSDAIAAFDQLKDKDIEFSSEAVPYYLPKEEVRPYLRNQLLSFLSRMESMEKKKVTERRTNDYIKVVKACLQALTQETHLLQGREGDAWKLLFSEIKKPYNAIWSLYSCFTHNTLSPQEKVYRILDSYRDKLCDKKFWKDADSDEFAMKAVLGIGAARMFPRKDIPLLRRLYVSRYVEKSDFWKRYYQKIEESFRKDIDDKGLLDKFCESEFIKAYREKHLTDPTEENKQSFKKDFEENKDAYFAFLLLKLSIFK